MVYLEQLRSFCAVVEQGSHTRAARALHLTQPAVSEHVRSLERTFGLALLARVGGRMRLTAEGEAVYSHVLEIVAQMSAIQDTVNTFKGLHGGQVTIGAGLAVGNYVLPQLLADFRRRYPEVRVEIRVDNASNVFEQVLRGSVDFGIALGYHVPRGVVTESLYRDPLVLVVAPQHPLVGTWTRAIPRAVLATVPLVAFSEKSANSRRLCDQWLRQTGIEPRIEMEFDSAEPIKRVVASGTGAAFLYQSSVAVEVRAGLLKILSVAGPPLFGEFVLARRPRQQLSPAARAFLDMLTAGLKALDSVENVQAHAVERFLAKRRA